jgi:hypothetical protein
MMTVIQPNAEGGWEIITVFPDIEVGQAIVFVDTNNSTEYQPLWVLLSHTQSMVMHIEEKLNPDYACDECGMLMTDDEWERKHQPHESWCKDRQGCDCDCNVHARCCIEC